MEKGGNRQELHERIRQLSMEAGKNVKEKGLDNNLLELIAEDPMFGVGLSKLKENLVPSKYTGCAAHQVERFIKECIDPVLIKYKEFLGEEAEVKV